MRALSGGCAGEQIIIIEGSDLRSVRVTTGANGQKSQSSYAKGQKSQSSYAKGQKSQSSYAKGQKSQSSYAKGQKSQSSYAKGHMDDGRCVQRLG